MKQVDQLTFRSVNTSFEIAKASHIFPMAKIANPSFTELPNHFFHIRICTRIINNFYLHEYLAQILNQYTFNCCRDILRTIIYRNHQDRKSTRLNSSHVKISYAVFCLKKKTNNY